MQEDKSIDAIFGTSMTNHNTGCIYDIAALGILNLVRISFSMSGFCECVISIRGRWSLSFHIYKKYGAKVYRFTSYVCK